MIEVTGDITFVFLADGQKLVEAGTDGWLNLNLQAANR